MREILYTKYNSLRKPEFQIKTSIIKEDGKRFVVKSPMSAPAKASIERMQENYKKLVDLNSNIHILEYTKEDDSLKFAFLEGEDLMDNISFAHEDVQLTLAEIQSQLDLIFRDSTEYEKAFEMTEDFQKMFPGCVPGAEQALQTANLDTILSNYIMVGDELWCIDYEWVCDFEVPVRYLKYRSLLYLYVEKSAYLQKKISMEDYFAYFSYSKEDTRLFGKMEDCFQQYVHGENRKYIYTRNYEKKAERLQDMVNENQNLQEAVAKLENDVEFLNQYIWKLKRAIKNPVYGVKYVGEKVAKKMTKKK